MKPIDSQCRAFQKAIQLLGRPWTGLILTVLQAGPLRFSEIAERTKGLTDKMLSSRLKELEGQGLLVRDVEAGPPVRVAYQLSRKGRAFREVSEAIEKWGRELL